jgi:hypothetical protein
VNPHVLNSIIIIAGIVACVVWIVIDAWACRNAGLRWPY